MLNCKNCSGFSPLLNLVVVAGIIALLSGISIPFVRRYQPNLKLNAEAKSLASDLRYAQQLTITEQTTHKVLLDQIMGSYQILRIGLATTTIKTVSFDPEIFFSKDTEISIVEFNSYGAVNGDSVGQIVLENSQEKTTIINVKPSGYIQLSQ